MQFALLGWTPQTQRFIEEAAALGHDVAVAYEASAGRYELRAATPHLRLRDDWENLLLERDAEAVMVAGPLLPESLPADLRERRDDQLRKLVQGGMPLVVLVPACEAIVGFELEMIREDVRGVIVPAMPWLFHPAWSDVVEILSASPSPLGEIEFVQVDRFLLSRSREEVLAALANDAVLLPLLIGRMRRVSAAGAGRQESGKPSLANLTVHVEGEENRSARWSVHAASEFVGTRVTLQGSEAQVILTIPEADGPWRLAGPGLDRTYPPFQGAAAIIDELSRGQSHWSQACRAVEVMEAADRSLQRGRAIELYDEEHSEESSFKGVMAAGGCLLLLGTLTAFIAVAVLFALLQPKNPGGLWVGLQICLVVPFLVFLAAQLLAFGLSAHRRRKEQTKGMAGSSRAVG